MAAGGEPGGSFGGRWDVRWVDETGSTNADLLARARLGTPEGAVLAARFQRAGRGRRGRAWVAPPGTALLASVLLRPALAPAEAHRSTLAAGLAAVDACREVAGVAPGLKWPNDVVVDGPGGTTAKLAGLLGESLVEGDRLVAVVVGMGCNLTAAPPGAACLAEVAGHPVGPDALLAAWLGHLDERLSSSSGTLLDDYRRRCTTLGHLVRVDLDSETVEGRAAEVTDEGHLVVETPSGARELTVGDVIHLCTAPVP